MKSLNNFLTSFLPLKFIAFVFLTIAASILFVHAQQKNLKIEWLFDIKEDENDYPGGKIYLLVGKQKVLVFPEASEYYSIIEHKGFKRNKIPAAAVTAIFGWYAGQGKTLYVIRRANRLIVYIKYFDEGAPDFPVERLKTIRLPQ